MKKTIFFIPIALVFIFQNTHAQTIRAKAGINIASMYLEDGNGIQYQPSSKVGFHIGATWERPTPIAWLSYEGGVLLSTKGVKTNDNELKLKLTYLDVPFHVKATHDIGTIKAFGTLGTYFGIGLNAKEVNENKVTPVHFGTGKDFKRVDFGLSFGAGVDFSSATFGFSYNHGITNISAETPYIAKNRVFSISCAYKIASK
jgi:hypothetical protein